MNPEPPSAHAMLMAAQASAVPQAPAPSADASALADEVAELKALVAALVASKEEV